MAKIIVKLADRIVDRYIFKGSACVIGREESCDICIQNVAVSRHHAEIRREGDHLLLRDLGSTNGTFLNGKRVRASEMSDGDVIRIGLFELHFDMEAAAIGASRSFVYPRQPTFIMDGPISAEAEKVEDYLASVLSPVFHLRECFIARRIPDNRKLFFSSPEEAEASGRRRCRVCSPPRRTAVPTRFYGFPTY